MVVSCCAYNCKEKHSVETDISFHSFPLAKGKEATLEQWIVNLRRENFIPTKASRICSKHFEKKCFDVGSNLKRNLRQGAVPTIFDFPKHLIKKRTERSSPKKRLRDDDAIDMRKSAYLHDHTYSSVKSAVELLEEEIIRTKQLRKKLKVTQTVSARRYASIVSLKEVLSDLKKQDLLNKDIEDYVESSFSGLSLDFIKNELGNNKKMPEGRRYSDEIKSFALTLFYHSPKAYEYLRQHFALPGKTVIRSMLTNINCDPGFTGSSKEFLSSLLEKDPANKYCTLMLDGMHIMKHVQRDEKSHSFLGYINHGEGTPEHDNQPIATEALVLMAVGSFRPYKVPLGYFLINGVNGSTLAMLVKESIKLLNDVKMRCVAVVCDGLSANLSMAQELGCQLKPDLPIKTYFDNPSAPGEKVYFMLDVCHVFKLTRNLFGQQKMLRLPDLGVIEWRYLEELVNLQESEGLHCATKIRRKHLDWQNQKMKVSLAAQTLSSSVSKALMLLSETNIKFKSCMATARWIGDIDRLFDILNSRNPRAIGFKAPLKPSNYKYWRPFLVRMMKQLRSLELMNGQKVLNTPKKTCVLGFIITIQSFLELHDDIFEKNIFGTVDIKYILTYKFSQDHLELLFNCIRGRNGWCNNPTAIQFRAAYRYIICRACKVKPSKTGNVVAQSCESIPEIQNILSLEDMLEVISITSEIDDDDEALPDFSALSAYVDNVVTYIAGFVVRSVRKKIPCDDCIDTLTQESAIRGGNFSLIDMKDNGGLLYPSEDLVALLRNAEQFIKPLLSNSQLPSPSSIRNAKNEVLMKALRQNLFKCLDKHSFDMRYMNQNHAFTLMKMCTHVYFNLRMHHAAKEKTALLKGPTVRKKLTKLILFKNQ